MQCYRIRMEFIVPANPKLSIELAYSSCSFTNGFADPSPTAAFHRQPDAEHRPDRRLEAGLSSCRCAARQKVVDLLATPLDDAGSVNTPDDFSQYYAELPDGI